MQQDTVADFINIIRKGKIFIAMKDNSRVSGKFIDITPADVIVDCDIFHNATLKTTSKGLGRISVDKRHIERYMILFEGGKKGSK